MKKKNPCRDFDESSRFEVLGVRKRSFKKISCVLCTLYSMTVARDAITSEIKMKLWTWDKIRTEIRFSGSCVISGPMEGSLLEDTLAYLQIFQNPL